MVSFDSLSSVDTPLPVPKGTTRSDESPSPDLKALQCSLIRILKQSNIDLDEDAAECLLDRAVVNGILIDAVIDKFYEAIRAANVSHVTYATAIHYLSKNDGDLRVTVINCFENKYQYIWDPQTQKYTKRDDRKKCLLPDKDVFYSTFRQRYHRAINRVKACPDVVWWSEAQTLQQMTITYGDRLVVRPAECAKGLTGAVSVLGVLRSVQQELHTSRAWILEDGSQQFILDLSKWIPNGQLFLDTNIVVITGEVYQEKNVLLVKDVAHPPFNDAFNVEECDPLWKKLKTNVVASIGNVMTLHTSCQWIVFGVCHLDKSQVISNIYAVLSQYDPSSLSGIVLTGEFYSKPFNAMSKDVYLEGFKELFSMLKQWIDQLNADHSRITQLVLVPGANDAGPRFLPKIPLLEAMITYPQSSTIKALESRLQIILGSNPTWLEARSREQGSDVNCDAVICRHDMIQDIDIFNLALHLPFKHPLYPTASELIKTIPPLIIGQGHLYPVPFRSPHSLRIAFGYDFMLQLSSLPKMVILSDVVPVYATQWKSQCWFCSPGSIEDETYLLLDLIRNEVKVCGDAGSGSDKLFSPVTKELRSDNQMSS